jgi:hypothetical protein
VNKAADSHPTGRKPEQILSLGIRALPQLLLNHDGLHTHGQNTPNESSSNPSIPMNPPMPEILVSRILSLHSKHFYKKTHS